MKRLTHSAILISLALVFGMTAMAQKLNYVGGGVMQGDRFQLVYELSGADNAGAITPPTVEGAHSIYHTPPQKIGESMSKMIVNGKVIENNSSSIYRYTITYKASKTGTLKVGTASVLANGRKVMASGFTFNNATSGRQSAAAQVRSVASGPVNYNDPFSQTADREINSKDLFVRISMSRPRVYEQQAVVCTIKLYTKFPIKEMIALKQSSFAGFLIEDITPNFNSTPNVESMNGQNYYTVVLKKCILYPQKSGALTINSGEFEVTPVQYVNYVGLNSAIAVPTSGNKLRIKSNSATVAISPLPEPRPAGFTGAVGDFSVKTSISPSALKTYVPATLTCVVTGSGNIKYVKAPSVPFPKEFDTYDPQNKINTSSDGDDVHGNVVFTYQFIPQYVGKFVIPAHDFVFFNPNSGKYETIKIAAQSLDVAKGNGKPSAHYKGLKERMTDILSIKTGNLNTSKEHTFHIDQWYYWLGFFIAPFLLLCAVLIYNRKLIKERADVQRMRTKRAGKMAQKRLMRAKKYMQAGQKEAFYAEVLTATWGYLSDKLTIPVSALSKDNIEIELEKYGVKEPLRKSTLDLLDKCEFAQYAQELANNDMNAVYTHAASLMASLEKVKREKTKEEA